MQCPFSFHNDILFYNVSHNYGKPMHTFTFNQGPQKFPFRCTVCCVFIFLLPCISGYLGPEIIYYEHSAKTISTACKCEIFNIVFRRKLVSCSPRYYIFRSPVFNCFTQIQYSTASLNASHDLINFLLVSLWEASYWNI